MTDFLRVDMGPMNLITTNLYLGNIPNALNLPKDSTEFWAILNCTDDPGLDHLNNEEMFHVVRLNQWDGEEYPGEAIDKGIEFIDSYLRQGSNVLVCCHAGMSRSPGMVLAYLLSKNYSYNEAVRMIRKARPFIQIHPKIDLSVRKHFGLAPRTVADLVPGKNVSGY